MPSSSPPATTISQPPSERPLSVNESLAHGMMKHLLTFTGEQYERLHNDYVQPTGKNKRISRLRYMARWARSMVPPYALVYSKLHQAEHGGNKNAYYRQLYWVAKPENGKATLRLEMMTIPARTLDYHIHLLVTLSRHAQMRLYHRLGTISHDEVLRELDSFIANLNSVLTLCSHSPLSQKWLVTTPRGFFVLARDRDRPLVVVIKTWLSNRRLMPGSRLQHAVQQAHDEGEGLIVNDPPYYPIISRARLDAADHRGKLACQVFNELLQAQYPADHTLPESVRLRENLSDISNSPLASADPTSKLPNPHIVDSRPLYRKALNRRPVLGPDMLASYVRQAKLTEADVPKRGRARAAVPRMGAEKHGL